MGLHARASLLTARVRLIVALSPPVCQPGICMAAMSSNPKMLRRSPRALTGRPLPHLVSRRPPRIADARFIWVFKLHEHMRAFGIN
jgi:hypothetical protein